MNYWRIWAFIRSFSEPIREEVSLSCFFAICGVYGWLNIQMVQFCVDNREFFVFLFMLWNIDRKINILPKLVKGAIE